MLESVEEINAATSTSVMIVEGLTHSYLAPRRKLRFCFLTYSPPFSSGNVKLRKDHQLVSLVINCLSLISFLQTLFIIIIIELSSQRAE